MATIRRHHLAALAAALFAFGAAPAGATAATHVNLRVEGPAHTIVASNPQAFVGQVNGHNLARPTVLGGLITATSNHDIPLDLQWFDCCGFFVNSIDGVAADATHYWAFKIGRRLAALGAGETPASDRRILFYYTSFDPVTFETQPTLNLTSTPRAIGHGGQVRFTVTGYDDFGNGTREAGARVWEQGRIVGRTDADGRATLTFPRAGAYPVRATFAGTIRSQRLWVTVS